MDDLTTERSFDSQATRVIDLLGLFFSNNIQGCVYNHALTGVRLTGIQWLYCLTEGMCNAGTTIDFS